MSGSLLSSIPESVEKAAAIIWANDSAIAAAPEIRKCADLRRHTMGRLLRACAVLVRSDYGFESGGIVRTIWEEATTAHYIALKPQVRSLEWLNAGYSRPAQRKDPLTSQQWWTGYCSPIKRLKNEISLVEADVCPTATTEFVTAYNSVYQLLCDDTHAHPFTTLASEKADPYLVDLRLARIAYWAVQGAYHFCTATAEYSDGLKTDDIATIVACSSFTAELHRQGMV